MEGAPHQEGHGRFPWSLVVAAVAVAVAAAAAGAFEKLVFENYGMDDVC